MPYLGPRTNEQRLRGLTPECGVAANTAELNFQITKVIDQYIDRHGVAYDRINDVVGALECAKREFQRRVADPYEQRKLEQNGDVYAPDVIERAERG